MRPLFGIEVKKLSRWDTQRICDPLNITETYIALAPLNGPDVCPMESRQFGEFFLGQPCGQPASFEVDSEGRNEVCHAR